LPVCVITNLPARYRDPGTNLPYANVAAYREIQRLHRGEYRWSQLLGAWVGGTASAARGVPGRFLNPDFKEEVTASAPVANAQPGKEAEKKAGEVPPPQPQAQAQQPNTSKEPAKSTTSAPSLAARAPEATPSKAEGAPTSAATAPASAPAAAQAVEATPNAAVVPPSSAMAPVAQKPTTLP
jgi:vacuolar protein sorting-associated protein 72